MKVAVIPARGGSKRIPGKNIRPFGGRPMMAWPIAAAIESGCFDRIIVSTDDPVVAGVARECGAEAPFVRPDHLSDDHATSIDVIVHAVKWLRENGAAPDKVCCLYATSPFVEPEDFRRALSTLEREQCDYVFSATSYAFPVQRALRKTLANRVEMLYPEHEITRSQDLEETFHDAGQFYWGTAEAWVAGRPIYSGDSMVHLLPRHRVQDIDTPDDWNQAELMFRILNSPEDE